MAKWLTQATLTRLLFRGFEPHQPSFTKAEERVRKLSEKRYVLVRQNGNAIQYAQVTKTGGTKIVANPDLATVFKSKNEAEQRKKKAPSKLKRYKVVEQSPLDILEQIDEGKSTPDVKPTPLDIKPQCNETKKRKPFSTAERNAVYNQAEGRCAICGQFVPYDEFTIDHIVPLAKGGGNEPDNLQCACRFCNQLKGSLDDAEMMKKIISIVTMKAEADIVFRKKMRKSLKRKKK